MSTVKVNAIFDESADVWIATSDDVTGLVVEAETLGELEEEVETLVLKLIPFSYDEKDYIEWSILKRYLVEIRGK